MEGDAPISYFFPSRLTFRAYPRKNLQGNFLRRRSRRSRGVLFRRRDGKERISPRTLAGKA